MDTKSILRTDLKFSPEYLPCSLDLIPRNIPQMQVDMEYMKPHQMWSAAMKSWSISQTSLTGAPEIWQVQRYIRPGMNRTIDILTLDYEMQVIKDLPQMIEILYAREQNLNPENQMHDIPPLLKQIVLEELRDHLHQMFTVQPARALMMTTTKPEQEYLSQDPWSSDRRNHFRTIYQGLDPQDWDPRDSEMYLYLSSKTEELMKATRQEVSIIAGEEAWRLPEAYQTSRMSLTESLVNLPSLSEEEAETAETKMMETLFRISQTEIPLPLWIPLELDEKTKNLKVSQTTPPGRTGNTWREQLRKLLTQNGSISTTTFLIPPEMSFQEMVSKTMDRTDRLIPAHQEFLTQAVLYQMEHMIQNPQQDTLEGMTDLMFPIRIKMDEPSAAVMENLIL